MPKLVKKKRRKVVRKVDRPTMWVKAFVSPKERAEIVERVEGEENVGGWLRALVLRELS